MKQILWFAQKNSYDLVYLTAFKDQAVLIRVLEYFGFKTTGPISLDEQIYEKALPRGLLIPDAGADLFDLARTNYPRFVGRPPANAYSLLQGFAVLRHVETLHFVLFADTQRNDERNRLEQKKSDNARPCECRGDAIKLQT